MKSEPAAPDFNARFDAVRKTYRYSISVGEAENPLKRLYSYYCRGTPDVKGMNSAARHLLGRHDFTSFVKEADPEKDAFREIYRAEALEAGGGVSIEIEGNRWFKDSYIKDRVELGAGPPSTSTLSSSACSFSSKIHGSAAFTRTFDRGSSSGRAS